MKHIVDPETKTVYFEGDYPTVMGIPNYMKKYYPDYKHKVVNWKEFREMYDKA